MTIPNTISTDNLPDHSNNFESPAQVESVNFYLPQAAPVFSFLLEDGNSKENESDLFYQIPLQQNNEEPFLFPYGDLYDYRYDYPNDYKYPDYYQESLPSYLPKDQNKTGDEYYGYQESLPTYLPKEENKTDDEYYDFFIAMSRHLEFYTPKL